MPNPHKLSKTVDVFLPLPRIRAEAWLHARRIPFTHMRDMFQGVAFRIRRGYALDFMHQKDLSAPHYNPSGLSAKEERQYRDIACSGRSRYGKRAKEVAARTVLSRRRSARAMGARRRNPGSLPTRGELTRLVGKNLGVEVWRSGGYVEQVKYQDMTDRKHYVHDFSEFGAYFYLVNTHLGRGILIVPGDGETPLWEPA